MSQPFDDLSHPCTQCGGPGQMLGILGTMEWYRCRNCGWNFGINPGDKEDCHADAETEEG